MEPQQRGGDLVLPPGESAYVLDTTKGAVNIIVGPNKTSLSNTDTPVIWTPGGYREVPVRDARQQFINAPEGSYVTLHNPAPSGESEHPRPGSNGPAPKLDQGRTINIPGPAYFPLWPGQAGKVIPGHTLRSNQFLLVTVTNEAQARENWNKAIMKKASIKPPAQDDQQKSEVTSSAESSEPLNLDASSLTTGMLLVIKGSDVSFYIPPTGVEVVADDSGNYVRDALTLERLEYCILLDESGEKSYVRGPAVVFPTPTQTFVTSKGNAGEPGSRKFKAIELNPNSGIYIKVIADYEDGEETFRAGQELFITGAETAIYYPIPEHSIIKYNDQMIHYATAIPSGEGRYVLDRISGKVNLVVGPIMLLPDPRYQVIARRILTTNTVRLWFPGNEEALQFNRQLERQAIEEGTDMVLSTRSLSQSVERGAMRMRAAAGPAFGDEILRSSSYTKPRTITLDTKYDGAVTIDVWTGYAILVTNKTGDRRVIVGPRTVQLGYDETLQVMELSTGKPKTTDNCLQTVYLRVTHNKVSDIVEVETSDMVKLQFKISMLVSFTGDQPERWFAVDNYVKFLCDHVRSVLKSMASTVGVENLYTNATTIIRDTILGKKPADGQRPGMLFAENSLQVHDVEVLATTIMDSSVGSLLQGTQRKLLEQNLQVAEAKRDFACTVETETVRRQLIEERAKTEEAVHEAKLAELERKAEAELRALEDEADKRQKVLEMRAAENRAELALSIEQDTNETALFESRLARSKADNAVTLAHEAACNDQEIRLEQASAEAVRIRAQAVTPQLVSALQAFGDKDLAGRLAESMAPLAILGGTSVTDAAQKLMKGVGLTSLITGLAGGFEGRQQTVDVPSDLATR